MANTKDNTTLAAERARGPIHKSRAQDVWDADAIHDVEETPWIRGQSLAAPPARPGFVQRWIRVGMLGADDATNVARKSREGWKPRPASTIPAGFQVPTIAHGEWAGCLGVEGSVLMEMPKVMADKRKKFVEDRTETITNSLESNLQEHSRPDMKITQERKTSAGRLVKVADE